jgi:NitT/TauT family transport system permease protein
MRILLGWAWTYLIIAEVVGTMSGITYFINQQARWRHYDNVYAAIFMIGLIGFGCDLLLSKLGNVLFPWKRQRRGLARRTWLAWIQEPGPGWRKPVPPKPIPAPAPVQP